MSDLSGRMRREAGAIAAAVPPPSASQVAGLSVAAARKRQARTGMVVAAASVALFAVGGLAIYVTSRSDAVTPVAPSETPSPSITPTPSESPSSQPQPSIIEGFAPVPQFPASKIPWDQVGPGWFAVDYGEGLNTSMAGDEWAPTPDLEGGLSLVSPDGQWYAAQPHSALGNGPVEGWDGVNFWMTRETSSNVEAVLKRFELVDSRTAEVQSSDEEYQGTLTPFAPGRALYYAWGGDGLVNSVVAAETTDQDGGCSDIGSGFWGWEAPDMSFLYNPVYGGGIICFGPAERDGSTYVQYVPVSSLEGTTGINTFSHPAFEYTFIGWIDKDRFFFARNSGGADPVVFRYDLTDDSITEVSLPIYDDVDGWYTTGYFDRVSQRHVISAETEDGWTIDLYEANGNRVAALAGECLQTQDATAGMNLRTSGGRLLLSCPDAGYVDMYDLNDGSRLGRWDVGGERSVALFDAPDH